MFFFSRCFRKYLEFPNCQKGLLICIKSCNFSLIESNSVSLTVTLLIHHFLSMMQERLLRPYLTFTSLFHSFLVVALLYLYSIVYPCFLLLLLGPTVILCNSFLVITIRLTFFSQLHVPNVSTPNSSLVLTFFISSYLVTAIIFVVFFNSLCLQFIVILVATSSNTRDTWLNQ